MATYTVSTVPGNVSSDSATAVAKRLEPNTRRIGTWPVLGSAASGSEAVPPAMMTSVGSSGS